ncbi:hypothetical protein ACIQUB_08310 [Rhizobium sp. NPDC090275]|uniref:hypothetical protein n=1 Tax=Rhizobium sp. NPDC090275 TaxID=3364498 RepID=UPI00383A4C61
MAWATNGQVSTDELDDGIEISDDDYALAIDGILAGKIVTIEGGFALIDPPQLPVDPEPTLDELKARLKATVDMSAELERGKYITAGSGQAMTYMQKASEASALLASENPVASDYPLLSAEVGITAGTIQEVAAIVNAAFVQWQQIGAAIEAVRLSAKASIDAAQSTSGALAAAENVNWP